MSKVRDTLFGDQGKGAAKAQSQQNEQERQFIQQQTELARRELNRLYPQMQQNTVNASNAALNVLRGAVPAQVNIANQGASNAMAAILGGQINPITADLSFMNQSMPQITYDQQQIPQSLPAQTQRPVASGTKLGNSVINALVGRVIK